MTAVRYVGAVAALLALCGCESSGPPPTVTVTADSSRDSIESGSPTTPAQSDPKPVAKGRAGAARGGAVGAVDAKNASSVARAYAMTVYAHDTRLDRSPNDAARRARRWMTPQLASVYDKPMPGGGDADWQELVRRGGFTRSKVVEVEASNSGALRATRVLRITTTSFDRNRRVFGVPEAGQLEVTLVRESRGAGWLVLGQELA